MHTLKASLINKEQKKLKELQEIAEHEKFLLTGELGALEKKIAEEKTEQMLKYKDRILHEIEQEIVGRYYFQSGKVRKNLVNDPEIKEAIKLLNDRPRYDAILAGK